MYSITITITCNHKNQRLQVTFRLLKTCNRLHVITVTDYNYNRSEYVCSLIRRFDNDVQTCIVREEANRTTNVFHYVIDL